LEGESIAGIELRKVKLELEDYRRKKDRQINQLQAENNELQEQLAQHKAKYATLSTQKLELERETELREEHTFNTQIMPSPMARPRVRTASNRTPKSLTQKANLANPLTVVFSPRDRSIYRNVLKKGWFLVQEDGEDECEQFFSLNEEALLGYASESIDALPADSILTRINFDVVANLSNHNTHFIIKLKNGHQYRFTGPEAGSWCKTIKELLPDA